MLEHHRPPTNQRNPRFRPDPPGRRVGRRFAPLPLAAALIALVLAPAPIGAAEGIFMTWSDCYLGPLAALNRNFDCLSNGGQSELYCAFSMPQSADKVVAVEIVVDIQHSAALLPDWWRFDSGGCREGTNLVAAADFPGRTACLDMWQGAVTPAIAMVQGYIPTEPRGAASTARIKVAASVLPADAVTVDGTNSYYAARIIITHAKSTGNPTCAGCDEPACLVLNSILVGRLPGSPGGDYFLQTPGPGDGNWARWQGGGGANCAAVPIRNRAWGQLKGLYR